MSEPSDVFSVTGVAGGLLDDTGESALLAFDAEGGPLKLVLPVAELIALLSVCVGLAGQKLPDGPDEEHFTIPVADWRVGVTAAQAVVLGFAPQAGGALTFNLTREQARAMCTALVSAIDFAKPAARRH